jgi:hypothetical protein
MIGGREGPRLSGALGHPPGETILERGIILSCGRPPASLL